MTGLLVVAGEASGDRAAAAVLRRLDGVQAFGLGGPALERQGVDLVCDLRASTAMGLPEVCARAPPILRSWIAVLRAVRARRPRAALLVNYSEYNSRLAPRLRAAGVPVVWYGAPQVWAWRAGRCVSLGRHVNQMAVMLPFEQAIWCRAGVSAAYVGHPSLEAAPLPRGQARVKLAMDPRAEGVAVLPGSRPHEVESLLIPMLEACGRLRRQRPNVEIRVLVAPSLDQATRTWLLDQCISRKVAPFDVSPLAGAMEVLAAFDAALCASGTASLEAVLAGAVPTVAYRVGRITELAARLLVRTRHLALPNVLLGRRVFPELIQDQARADRLAEALADGLDRRQQLMSACTEVRARLGSADQPSAAVAAMLAPWVDRGSRS